MISDSHPFERDIAGRYKVFCAALENASEVDHPGVKGHRIEEVVANFLREVVPGKYAISTNQIIVDCHGKLSRECDIVFYDAQNHWNLFSNYLPIEVVYGVLEVKKHLRASDAKDFREKVKQFRNLNYRGHYDNGTETQLREQKFHFDPPSYNLFAISTEMKSFETFIANVVTDPFANSGFKNPVNYSTSMTYFSSVCGALDMGATRNSSIGPHSNFAVGTTANKTAEKFCAGQLEPVYGPKALYLFLSHLEHLLSCRKLVKNFDNRVYLLQSETLDTVLQPDIELVGKARQSKED